MSVSIPDGLPSLAAGRHAPGSGQACVMEYVSILAGEKFSDHPQCTHPRLAVVARFVNDSMASENRYLLIPLIGRLFGTSERSPEIDLALEAASHSPGWYCVCSLHGPVRAVQELSDLIDIYDRLSGRTEVQELSAEDLHALSAAVVPAA